jgi:hypothetical protein
MQKLAHISSERKRRDIDPVQAVKADSDDGVQPVQNGDVTIA